MALLSRNKKPPTQDLTREIGVAGDVLFTGYENEETRADKVSIKKYREMMDRDPTVESLFNIFTLPIVAATYRIDADEDDANEEQANFIRRNLLEPPHKGGMETPFTLFQDQLLMAIVDGFALWEKVYKIENGRYVYKKLAYRDSVGITLKRDKEGGYGGARQIVSYGGDAIDVTLIPYKTFLFTHNKSRDYLYGRSAFRSLRKPYEKKAKLEYLDSVALQADAIKPKILVRTEAGVVGDDDGDKSKASNVKNRILSALSKLGERNAVASIPFGYDVKEITQKGRDPHQSIERQNSEMARVFMATFSLMSSQGSSNVGSYALSDNLRDMLMISLKAFMSKAEGHINQYLIADLIDLNFANPHYPEFHYDDLTSDTVQVIADAFMKLLEKDRISDEMVEGIEEATANRLEIDLEQIKKDRKGRTEKEAEESAKSTEATKNNKDAEDGKGGGSELSDMSTRDFPGLHEDLGINTDELGCIMLDLQPFDVLKHVPDAQADLYVTDEAHSGGAVVETEAHVTLLYGLLQNGNTIKEQVDKVLTGWKCDSVVLEQVDSFPVAPDAPSVPIVARLWSQELQDANKRLSLLPHVNTFTEYNPHVTLAYVKNDPDIVQKWVKALNQVIGGMRISATGINYGDLPKDEEDDANSGGKFLLEQLSDGSRSDFAGQVELHNKNHDGSGRFTYGSGGSASGTVDQGDSMPMQSNEYLKKTYGGSAHYSEAQSRAINEYSGTSYADINDGLRKGKKPGQTVKELDGAFESTKLKSDTVVYRGATNNSSQTFKEGQVLRDKGYSSTSMNKLSAEGFLDDGKSEPYVMKITVPKGSKVVIPSLAAKAAGATASESEILLPRGSSFKITNVTRKHDTFDQPYNLLEASVL